MHHISFVCYLLRLTHFLLLIVAPGFCIAHYIESRCSGRQYTILPLNGIGLSVKCPALTILSYVILGRSLLDASSVTDRFIFQDAPRGDRRRSTQNQNLLGLPSWTFKLLLHFGTVEGCWNECLAFNPDYFRMKANAPGWFCFTAMGKIQSIARYASVSDSKRTQFHLKWKKFLGLQNANILKIHLIICFP